MEQLRKEDYARNTSIIVPIKEVYIKNENDMVVGWEFNHSLLQYKLMLCKHNKHTGSFAVIFLMFYLVMFSTWMVVDSVVTSQDRAPVVIVNVNMFCRLVSQVIIS
jgi:hypothetical protein